jgi:hypothetical protein
MHRSEADTMEIEAGAKRRLADAYDAAQARGEVATRQNNPGSARHVPNKNMPVTAADIGLTRKEIHEARVIRDAEARDLAIRQFFVDPPPPVAASPHPAVQKAPGDRAARDDDRPDVPRSRPRLAILDIGYVDSISAVCDHLAHRD